MQIDGVGETIADSFIEYFKNEKNLLEFKNVLKELTIIQEVESQDNEFISGKTFVITGSLEYFNNRDEAKEIIEKLGGKVTGSVTKKTDYLINNDINSSSSKNKKAKELGIPIITESDFINLSGVKIYSSWMRPGLLARISDHLR